MQIRNQTQISPNFKANATIGRELLLKGCGTCERRAFEIAVEKGLIDEIPTPIEMLSRTFATKTGILVADVREEKGIALVNLKKGLLNDMNNARRDSDRGALFARRHEIQTMAEELGQAPDTVKITD